MMQSVVIILMAMATVSTASTKSVSSAYYHTCAMVNNDVRCWGYNGEGQCGLGHKSTLYEPQDDAIDFGDFVPSVLDCGTWHCCVIDSDIPGVKCWGRNLYGELGYGDTNHRGDESGEMGTNLPLVELPSGFVPSKLALQGHSTCILSTGGKAVCFGYNSNGNLGLAQSQNIGDGSGEMGENMAFVDTGADFGVITDLIPQRFSVCAVNSDGQVKCWGHNGSGQLGLGDTNNRGDASNEMGDFLPYTELGTGFIVQSMDCGASHCCVLSTENVFKCFGDNGNGRLGYEDTNNRGDSANEMDDFLLAVSLGSGFVVQEFGCSWDSTCAISTEGQLKCFGYNNYGQLGLGDTSNRGDGNNEMGDYLPVIDVGSGFTASGMRIGGAMPYLFRCIFEDSVSTDLGLKCFGRNNYGQLGYGDTSDRGDASNEMGENLLFMSFGDWPVVGTSSPTPAPSSAPSSPPTASPTMSPSAAPTDQCSADALHHANWNNLITGTGDDSETNLLRNHAVTFDASALLLTFQATLEYVGESADGVMDHTNNLGTTYWIDLQSFSEYDSMDNGIANAGSCGNRRAADYGPLTFDQFWKYPVDPADLANTSKAGRMAYPPSDWTLTASGCNVVEYERTFSLADLAACTDAAGTALVTKTQSETMLSFSGSFFVEMVSPYSASMSDFYRTFSLLEYGFDVQLARSAQFLASTGLQLSLMTVHAITNDEDGNYRVLVLSQTADYIELDGGALMTAPDAVTVSGVTIEQKTTSCFSSTSFVCGQLFAVTIPKPADLDCSDSSSSTVDLSGTFSIAFTPSCRLIDGSEDVRCSAFMAELPQSNQLLLDAALQFEDATCGPNLFTADIGASMTFYAEDTFSTLSTTFTIARDTVYCEVAMSSTTSVHDASGTAIFDLISVSVENVYVCTSATDLSASLSGTEGDGGCLSSDIDTDGYYTVIGTGADTQFGGRTDYAAPSSNVARFSFAAFETGRSTINVHVEVLVTLQNEAGERRRRMLLQNVGSNQIRHFIGSSELVQAEQMEEDEASSSTVMIVVVAAIGGAAVVGVMVFVVMMLMRKKGGEKKEETEMVVHVSAQSPSSVTLETNMPSAVASTTSSTVSV